MAIVEVRDLVKIFRVRKRGTGPLGILRRKTREVHAVDGISFDVEEGEIVGYIGPNGAGKSTTVKCLTGILVPTSGVVTVGGLVPWRDRIKNGRQIGVVFGQKTSLWWDVPVIDTYRLLRDIYDVPEPVFRRNLGLLDDILGLKEFQDTPVRQLSLGQRVRADLGAVMLHNPRFLFLDEPTIGLDVAAKERLRVFIANMNAATRVTVFLTTHDMSEIERLCRRIMIIDRGRLVYSGSISDAIQKYAPCSDVVVELAETPSGPVVVEGGEVVRQEGARYWIRFRRDQTTAGHLVGQLMAKYPVKDFRVDDPNVEQIVKTVYGALAPVEEAPK